MEYYANLKVLVALRAPFLNELNIITNYLNSQPFYARLLELIAHGFVVSEFFRINLIDKFDLRLLILFSIETSKQLSLCFRFDHIRASEGLRRELTLLEHLS